MSYEYSEDVLVETVIQKNLEEPGCQDWAANDSKKSGLYLCF